MLDYKSRKHTFYTCNPTDQIAAFDLFAKAGVVRSSQQVVNAGDDDDDTDFAVGGGAQFRLGKLAVRLDYDRYGISNAFGYKLATKCAVPPCDETEPNPQR